ncbi:MAG: glycosyltransferase [Bifidobacteriaceae bacterium]|nr:glycosyltransferase [Bifidobacteriaceae bacterium]
MFLTSRLDAQHGGLTASLLRKAGVAARRLGIDPLVASFHDDAAFPQIAAEIQARYELPAAVRLANINHHYRTQPPAAETPPGREAIRQLCADLPAYSLAHCRDAAGSPYAATANAQGQPVRRFWLRPDGTVFQYRDLAAPGGAASQVVLHPLTAAERRFRTVDGFRRHFMDELCAPPITYLVGEARLLDNALLGLENRWARKIFVFHSIHIRPNSDVVRAGNRALLRNLAQADALVVLTPQQRADVAARFGFADRIHVIPHAIAPAAAPPMPPPASGPQAAEPAPAAAAPPMPPPASGPQAPEPAPAPAAPPLPPPASGPQAPEPRPAPAAPAQRQPPPPAPAGPPARPLARPAGPAGGRQAGKVVVVSRLAPEKNLAAAIGAFQTVARARPDARLEIWGEGPEAARLKHLVRDLELEPVVRFAGYTDNASAVFRSAECSLLTSRWEGFPLTVLESMAAGTPCIAYDAKYGPAAMIESGVNGHLVPPGDQDLLAQRVISFLGAPASAKREMSSNAANAMAEFSEAALAERWSALFAALAKPKAARPPWHKRLWRRLPRRPREALARLLHL